MCHEDSEIGEVTASTGGVGLVGLHQSAALCGPVSHHGTLRIVPERAIGIEVILVLCGKKNGSGCHQ